MWDEDPDSQQQRLRSTRTSPGKRKMLQNIPIILLVAIAVLPLTLVRAQGYPVNPEQRCGINQQYYSDCKPCPTYCGNVPVMCPKICTPGCGCKPGYVLRSLSSPACIPEENCI
ncbi:venom peptide SjAPI-like [Bombina bombina]|uniref:venom peptide SjAPI-like n=1 Tax=Bombina bombina TaxID=8345 RepID=UPI00235A9E56|nr:venom peptide SjAPI-like [Bombina bombina]